MSFPKSWLVGSRRVGFERLQQHVGVENVDAHRGQRDVCRAGNRRRVLRLLDKAGDAIVLVDRQHAEARRVLLRHFDGRQRHRRAALLVEAQHLRVVHFVDVIARQHDHVMRAFLNDRVEVLVDRVGGALIPVLADALLRRQNFDELAELFRHDVPAHADVAVQRERLVLRRDEDAPQSRIDAVAQREIDDAVGPAEEHGGLRAVSREGVQALAGASRQQYDQRIVEHC